MRTLIKNGHVVDFKTKLDKVVDVMIEDDKVIAIGNVGDTADTIIDAEGLYVVPGLVDMHCHLRDPGFIHKEDIETGIKSASRGGFTSIACMPNTKPVIDSKETIEYIVNKAKMQNSVNVYPIACITKNMEGNELTDMAGLKSAGAVAVSDDGKPVVSARVMKSGMIEALKNNLTIISHCEEVTISEGRESEEIMASRETILAKDNDLKVHIAHISTEMSVEIVRHAKKIGTKVTAETCPHYFSITEEKIKEKGTDAQMNPNLRKDADVKAIIEGIKDGTIDAIATDHAPHSKEEKMSDNAPNGIIGFETALKLVITYLIDKGHIDYMKLVELMCYNPARLLNIDKGTLEVNKTADITIFDPNVEKEYKTEDIVSKSKNSPFTEMLLNGEIQYTIINGKVVYCAKN